MKKSTLITTIAMIVVVVVALSTATYAWFSTTSTAVANVDFATTATGDWSMFTGSVSYAAGTGYTLTYGGSASDNIDLTSTAVQTGIWCPTTTISTVIADAQASTSLQAPVGFVSATKGATYDVVALQTAAFDSSLGGEGNGLAYPFALRMVNVSGKSKTLQLNITLNAGPQSTATTNSMYAASAVRFFIYEVKSTDVDANEDGLLDGTSYTSGYRYTSTSGLDAKTSIEAAGSIVEATPAITKSPNLKAVTKYADATDVENELAENVGDPIYTPVSLADYTDGNIARFFPVQNAANEILGIAQNDRVLTYTFDMGTYAANAYSNIIIYAWIDGWTANASAGDAHFSINFGFKSNSVIDTKVNGNSGS